ncbi:hypothetical protein D3C85_1185360 [compost metagenome]
MEILQTRCASHAKTTSGHIAILAHNQCLWYLWIVVKELKQTLNHALGMGGIVRVLPEK